MNLLSIELIGGLAGTLTTIAFLPQAWKIYKTGETKSISLAMFIVFVTGLTFWIVYGTMISQYPVIIPNVVTLIFAGYILVMKVKNRVGIRAL